MVEPWTSITDVQVVLRLVFLSGSVASYLIYADVWFAHSDDASQSPGLSIGDLVWKNTTFGFALTGRGGVPYKTIDGGETWKPLESARAIASYGHSMLYSWTGKTLAMSGSGGSPGDYSEHKHVGYVWTSTDDGETWEDHSGNNIATDSFGMAQWYEGKLYMGSMGQGAFYKTLE